jgi:hypothetical protein
VERDGITVISGQWSVVRKAEEQGTGVREQGSECRKSRANLPSAEWIVLGALRSLIRDVIDFRWDFGIVLIQQAVRTRVRWIVAHVKDLNAVDCLRSRFACSGAMNTPVAEP